MTQSLIMLNEEPKFDVRYGYQLEDGDFEYDKQFDVPLSKIQHQIRWEEEHYDDMIISGEAPQFVDAVFELNTDKKIKRQDILDMVLVATTFELSLQTKNKALAEKIMAKYGNKATA